MITYDLSILNQKGTPMFYSDTLSAIPAFGIAGRIFIDTAAPYGIYRDTGSAWVQIAGNSTIGGSGIANEISYWVSPSTIGSLTTTTYPSLTELSYVKGVTSSIQTQIGNKQDTITLTTSGTSGAATLIGSTLNIPNYAPGVTGSGAATQIAYFSGTTAITSSANLFWNNTNGHLGVNTTVPGAAIDAHDTGGTIIQANSTTLGNALMSFQLQNVGKWQIGNVYSAGSNYFRLFDQLNSTERIKVQNTGQIDTTGWLQNTNTITGITGTTPSALPGSYFTNVFTYNSGISTSASVNTLGLFVDNNLNYSGANTINVTSYNASTLSRNILTFGSAGASISYTQATGIRALANNQVQYLQEGANNGTISHYANIQVFGDNRTSTGLTTFTNRYGLLINDYNEFSAGNTYTNRWGIYQAGSSENNFFAGKVGIGSGYTPSTFRLDVRGSARSREYFYVEGTFGFNSQIVISNENNTGAFIGEVNSSLITTNYWIRRVATDRFILGGGGQYGTSFTFGCNSNVNGNYDGIMINNADVNGSNSSTLQFVQSYPLQTFITSRISSTANSPNFFSVQDPSLILWVANSSRVLQEVIKLTSNQNVLIGTLTDVASSILTLASTTKGFLPPRMTSANRNSISSPVAGLIVYQSTDNALSLYNGTAWTDVVTTSNYEGLNIAFGTTTGTKIGTATTEKIGFWNATPIVQPTTAVAAAAFVANTSLIADDTATFDGYTIGQIVKALRNEGLLA